MKNRILSFVLAVVMVFAMIPAMAIGVSAADGLGITFTVANYTVAAGGIAYMDLYASVDNLNGNDGICNFQVYFDLPEGVTIAETGYTIYCEGVKGVKSTVNVGENMICGTADAGELLVTIDQLTAKGGALLATVAFNVAENATGGEGEIVVNRVSDFTMRSVDGAAQTDPKASGTDLNAATFVPGTLTIGEVVTGAADAYEGAGETYIVPSVNAAGAKVVELVNDCPMTGSFDTLIIPATVAKVSNKSVTSAEYKAVALKNTQYTTLPGGVERLIEDEEVSTVYYHKRTNSADTTAAAVADVIDGEGVDVEMKNIMSAGAVVEGEGDTRTVTFYGNIVVEDVKYQDVFVEAVFTVNGEKRVFSTEENVEKNRYVYTTLTSDDAVLLSTDAEVAGAVGTYVEGSYLFGGVINNVPADAVSTLEVTAYGRTWDANGNLIYVCSDTYVWTPAA